MQGHILPLNLLSAAFSNVLIYLGCYILRMKSLLMLKLMGVLPQSILRPSSAFERDFAGAQQCHVMIPMDG